MERARPREDAPTSDELIAGAEGVLPGETATARAERKGLRALWPFLGPAFVAAVAYVDPGNFANGLRSRPIGCTPYPSTVGRDLRRRIHTPRLTTASRPRTRA